MPVKHTATFNEEEIGEAVTYYLAHRMALRAKGKPAFTIVHGYSDPREGSTPDRVSVSFDVEAIGPHEKGGQDK